MRRLAKIPKATRLYLEERDYRPLYHAVCAAVIVAAACFLFYKNFTDRGTLMAVDMTWPTTISRIQFKTVNTWYPFGSIPSSATIQWFFWIYPSSTIARLVGASAAGYMLVLFIFTFSLAGISMYALAYGTVRKLDLENLSGYAPFAGAVFAGVVYMYNPWSLHYFRPYFAYPIYALTPLLFLAMVRLFDRPTARNVILFALFATIANTSYNQTWFLGLFGSYLVFYVIKHRFAWRRLARAAKATLGTALVYLLVNANWVTPYVTAKMTGRTMLPFYSPQLTENMLRGLSANNTMANNLRLLSIWSWNIEALPGGLLLQALAFAVPVLVLVSMIVLRRKTRGNATVNYWAAVALVAMLLATGTSSVIKPLYKWLVLQAPGSDSFGWLLRVPERFLFFVPPFFALMLGLLVSRLLLKKPLDRARPGYMAGLKSLTYSADFADVAGKKAATGLSPEKKIERMELAAGYRLYRDSLLLAVLIMVIIGASLYPKALDFGQRVFNPAKVPEDYARVDEFINRTGENRVTWLPFYGPSNYVYDWAPEKKVSWFSVMISNPGLSSVYEVMNNRSYFNWLQSLYQVGGIPEVSYPDKELMLQNGVLGRLLWPFSTRYLVHDTSVKGPDFGGNLEGEESLKLAHGTRLLKVYEPADRPRYLWPATTTLEARSFFDNLSILQKMPAGQTENLAFTDGPSYFNASADLPAKYGKVELDDYSTVMNKNPGFEDTTREGFPWYWSEHSKQPRARIATDTNVASEGRRSLRVRNYNREQMKVSIMVGEEIPVPAGCVLSFEADIKYRNVNWTFASLEGYRDDTGTWVQLAQCPTLRTRDSDWNEYRCSAVVPPVVTRVRPALGAGWSKDPERGPGTTWFDDVRISLVRDELYERLKPETTAPEVTFTRVSAEEYHVSVRGAKKPFVLVQSESHDPLWVASYSDGGQVEPIPMYATINGYPIDRTGDFELTVRYLPQDWFRAGFAITILTLLACALYLVYDWKLPKAAMRRRSAAMVKRAAGRIRSMIEEPPR